MSSSPLPSSRCAPNRVYCLGLFIQYTTVSVADDIVDGSAGMDNAKEIMSRDPFWARAWDKTVSELRVKPIIRCENCTKSPEEIGGNTVFMVCGACKNKLNFIVHYCSQYVMFYSTRSQLY